MIEWPNHTRPWDEWRRAISGERTHHAWLLAGKEGLGKRDFAAAAARELVAFQGNARLTGDHPDIIRISHLPKDDKEQKKRDDGKPFQIKRNITVGQIREMQRRLTTRPTLGARRAIIIDPADDMESSASNALLKSLEEPPQGTYFLLIAHRPARLLPTIRSRCRVLRFPTLDRTELERMLAECCPPGSPQTQSAAVRAAEGSLGHAMRFVEQDLGSLAQLMERLLANRDTALQGRSDLARAIGKADRERFQAVFDLAQAIVADHARSTASHAHRLKLVEVHAELSALAKQAPTYNFDLGLLALEIGTLLTTAGAASEAADG